MDDASHTPEPRAVARVKAALAGKGLAADVRTMPASTRTAEEAAAACGCDVGQIVKSLVFRGASSGQPVLLLVSGRNRVDTARVAASTGEALTRPDATYVRGVTGFAIGGIPPLAHATPATVLVDAGIPGDDDLWAGAGTSRALFRASGHQLRVAIGGTVADVGC